MWLEVLSKLIYIYILSKLQTIKPKLEEVHIPVFNLSRNVHIYAFHISLLDLLKNKNYSVPGLLFFWKLMSLHFKSVLNRVSILEKYGKDNLIQKHFSAMHVHSYFYYSIVTLNYTERSDHHCPQIYLENPYQIDFSKHVQI